MYEKRTGKPSGQLRFWFPVPEGTEGAVDVSSFPWYAKSLTAGSKPKELLDAMASKPLVLSDDSQTVGGLAALQGSDMEAADRSRDVQCYLIMNIKGTKSHQQLLKAQKKANKPKTSRSLMFKLSFIALLVVIFAVVFGIVAWRAIASGQVLQTADECNSSPTKRCPT